MSVAAAWLITGRCPGRAACPRRESYAVARLATKDSRMSVSLVEAFDLSRIQLSRRGDGARRGVRRRRDVQDVARMDGVPVDQVVEVGQRCRVETELGGDLGDVVTGLDDVGVAAVAGLRDDGDDQHLA